MRNPAWTWNHALKALATIPISLHCWQGDDVGGFENFGGALGGGFGHRKLSRQGAHAGRTARRFGKSLFAHSRKTSFEPARLLRRVRRQKSGSRRNHAGTFQELDCVGQEKRTRPGFQSDLLLASEIRRRLHAVTSGQIASANSGSSIASARAKSARRWARRSAKPA